MNCMLVLNVRRLVVKIFAWMETERKVALHLTL